MVGRGGGGEIGALLLHQPAEGTVAIEILCHSVNVIPVTLCVFHTIVDLMKKDNVGVFFVLFFK